MTTTRTEIEVTDLTEFEFARPCMPFPYECSNEAAWLAHLNCCGMETPLCNKCKAKADEQDRLYASLDSAWKCGLCGSLVDDTLNWITWTKL